MFEKGGISMQQCPFCGTQWEGGCPCPSCGVNPQKSGDDSLFRPPADRKKIPQEIPPEFEVEKLLRWEPSPEPESPNTESQKEEKEAPILEEPEQSPPCAHKCFKRWQKITAAAVALAVVITAVAVMFWSQPQTLPPEPAFFVQDGMLMALPMGETPQNLGVYNEGMEESLEISPDHQKIAWEENGALKLWVPEEEVFSFSQIPLYAPKFSQDSRFLYGLSPEENENVLYQMDVATKRQRRVGPVGYGTYWEKGSLLVLYDASRFVFYDADTLQEIGSEEINGSIVSLSEKRIYYVENMEDSEGSMQLCCWQDGEKKVLLQNISNFFPNSDGSAYIECYQEKGEPIPIAELMNNDLGAEGEDFLQSLEGETVFPPNRCLYYFTGESLRPMGDDLTLYLYSQIDKERIMVSSPGYLSVEQVKGTFPLSELYQLALDFPEISFNAYISSQWPQENPVNFMAVEEKLFRLPENALQNPIDFRSMGNWVCLYQISGQELAGPTLWVGKFEGNNVSYQNSYLVPEASITDFMLTAEGDLYYWAGQHNANFYANGIEISDEVVPESIQCTSDGAVYFLEGIYSDKLALCRMDGEEREILAQQVESFTAYSRDSAMFLQRREDSSYDLFACTSEEKIALAAQQVDKLLPSLLEPLIDGDEMENGDGALQ